MQDDDLKRKQTRSARAIMKPVILIIGVLGILVIMFLSTARLNRWLLNDVMPPKAEQAGEAFVQEICKYEYKDFPRKELFRGGIYGAPYRRDSLVKRFSAEECYQAVRAGFLEGHHVDGAYLHPHWFAEIAVRFGEDGYLNFWAKPQSYLLMPFSGGEYRITRVRLLELPSKAYEEKEEATLQPQQISEPQIKAD